MADYNITLKGVPELEAALERLDSVKLDAIKKKQLTQMLNRARSPGGTPVDTGELRNSSSARDDEMGYTKDYAPHVEYGHRTPNGGYVQGQRFLQKNVEEQQEIYIEDLRNAYKEVE